MLKKIIFFLLVSFAGLMATAQETEQITVKAGEDIATVLSSYGMYRFPAFTEGTVAFKGGKIASGKMNYNIYLTLLQFIDANGDTLAISDPETIDSVTIGSNLFYYKKGYCQVMANYNDCKLLMKQKVDFRPVKLGAFGTHVSGTGAQTYESLSTPSVINSRLLFNEDIIVARETSYYLVYKKYIQEQASRRAFLSAFPDYKTSIETFIKTNNTNFKKLDDLEKLMAYCASLK